MTGTKFEIPVTLVAKLAAVVVHADEFFSSNGHDFDRVALERVVHDPEVKAWIESLGPLAPLKRNVR